MQAAGRLGISEPPVYLLTSRRSWQQWQHLPFLLLRWLLALASRAPVLNPILRLVRLQGKYT
jgi:hypothetical protein